MAYRSSQTGDVLFYVVGGDDEVCFVLFSMPWHPASSRSLCAQNELILVHVLEGLFTAISSLLKYASPWAGKQWCSNSCMVFSSRYQVEKLVLVDQIALLLLVIDELVDNGYVMAAACLGAAQQPTPAVAIVLAGLAQHHSRDRPKHDREPRVDEGVSLLPRTLGCHMMMLTLPPPHCRLGRELCRRPHRRTLR